ncbi:MAG: arylsulfatase [Bacteroidota bacterium]
MVSRQEISPPYGNVKNEVMEISIHIKYGFWGLALLLLASCSQADKPEYQKRPNIILIITDDQGFGDLGYYGNPNIRTPTLDSLAMHSVRFNAFLVSPVCAPTRAALMTGKYSMDAGVHDTNRGGAMMATEEYTLAEILRSAHYTTGMIGKWHLGDNYPMRPQDQGFEYTLNHLSGGIGQYGDWPNTLKRDSSYFDPILWKNGVQVQTTGYCTDVFTEAAMDFVEGNKENPFFLYLSYNAPHGPLQLPQEYYNIYRNIDPDAGLVDQGPPYPKVSRHSKENARKVYGMVTNIDDNLGKLFKKLKSLGLEDDTLVIFMTDNGPEHPRYIAGMRGRKGSVFQGGVRVPSFWHYPKRFKEPRDIETPAAHYDILPTLAQLTGAKIPKDVKLEGRSLMPLLTKEEVPFSERTINRYWSRTAPVRYRNVSTRERDWKLVGMGKDSAGKDKFALFDLRKDPFEQHDLATDKPETVAYLRDKMDQWFNTMEASDHILSSPMPIIGTSFERPVMLNQNDAHFLERKSHKRKLMYWDVEVHESKTFDFVVHLDRNLKTDGKLELVLGSTTETLSFEGKGQSHLKIHGVHLEKGMVRIMPKLYLEKNGRLRYHYPFYLEIQG